MEHTVAHLEREVEKLTKRVEALENLMVKLDSDVQPMRLIGSQGPRRGTLDINPYSPE